MLDAKLTAFVQKLHEQTLKGAIKWERTAVDSAYQVAFPNYVVRVWIQLIPGPFGEPVEDYVISLFNQDNVLIERINASDFPLRSAPIRDIHAQARRTALGLDKALDDLMGLLGPSDKQPK